MLILRLLACAAVVTAALPASAQTANPGSAPEITVPSAQNSGAGIPGKPGTESGRAPNSAGTGSNAANEAVREQDAAKIPGLPGNKSGPAVQPPSGSTSAQNAGNSSVQQKVRQNLEQAGFTDIQVMPSSFLVRAKDPSGNPIIMLINPDSVTAVTESGGTASVPQHGRTPNTGTTGSAGTSGNPSPTGR
jgi:hypothetical protein